MKGILRKIDNKWMVQYIGHPIDVLGGNESLVNYLPLHPDDVKQIEEARMKAQPHVDFVFHQVWEEVNGISNITTCGKLIKKDVIDELANKELINHLIDEFGEFKTTTIGADDKKSWWKKGYEKAQETLYTEEQMKLAFAYGKSLEPFDSFEDFIKSLKETK